MKYARIIPTCLLLPFLMGAAPATQPQARPPLAAVRNSVSRSAAANQAPVEISTGKDEYFKVTVDAQDVKLATWVLQPPAGTAIKGTVLLLHGFLATHFQVQNAAEALRKNGYRAVLVDLRGFGESTGQHITFGVLDAKDLVKVTDELQVRKLCGSTLGVYGTSMGAAISILYAAADPRVSAVIAVAPFASIRDEVPAFSRQALLGMGKYLSDEQLNSLANSVAEASGMDLDGARPLEAIKKTAAQILLIHGDRDAVIPHAASEELQAADEKRSELLTMKNRGHLDLCFDWRGELQKPAREWFDRYLAPQ